MIRNLLMFSLILLTSCKHYPADPENSFTEAKQQGLKVGIIHNPPFSVYKGPGDFDGTELEMIRKFARQEHMPLLLEFGSESDLIQKLEHYDLHVVIGGFTGKTIWKKKAGLTAPYDQKHVFLIPKGENRLLAHLESFIFSKKPKK